MNAGKLFAFALRAAPYFIQGKQTEPAPSISGKDQALLNLKSKDGAVIVILGTRDTGKTELAYRLAEFLGKPTFAISPEQKPHPKFIRLIKFDEIDDVPASSTLFMDDLPMYASNRDYHEAFVRSLERIIPMCRHERKLHLIFASQTAAQADRYILDCDCAFLKPLGLLTADIERPQVKKIYDNEVNPYFENKSDDWIHKHAFMLSRNWKGIVGVKKVTDAAQNS